MRSTNTIYVNSSVLFFTLTGSAQKRPAQQASSPSQQEIAKKEATTRSTASRANPLPADCAAGRDHDAGSHGGGAAAVAGETPSRGDSPPGLTGPPQHLVARPAAADGTPPGSGRGGVARPLDLVGWAQPRKVPETWRAGLLARHRQRRPNPLSTRVATPSTFALSCQPPPCLLQSQQQPRPFAAPSRAKCALHHYQRFCLC